MESSHVVVGGKEECNSSESGWTMYIASPTHEHGYDDDDDNDDDNNSTDKENEDRDDDGNEDDDDDDDSTASDASSGRSHREFPFGSNEGSHGTAHFKHAGHEGHSKSFSGKKPHKQVGKKKDERRIQVEKEGSMHKGTSASSHVQGKTKVSKKTTTR